MHGSWTTHHSGDIGGRPVEVKTHSGGGYRVSTTTDKDYDGDAYSDEAGTVIMPPMAKGTPIDIDSDTIGGLRDELAQEGFDQASIDEIVGHFP